MQRHLVKTVRELWRVFVDVFDRYRPERHYMRGPGPKYHAKRAGLMARTPVAAAGAATDFANLRG